MARLYARVSGVLLLALGVAGFLLAGDPLFGVLNTDAAENVVHLAAGAILITIGFLQKDALVVGIVVLAVSSAFVLIAAVGFFFPTLFGLVPGGLSVTDDMLHLILGAAGIASVGFPRGSKRRREKGSPR